MMMLLFFIMHPYGACDIKACKQRKDHGLNGASQQCEKDHGQVYRNRDKPKQKRGEPNKYGNDRIFPHNITKETHGKRQRPGKHLLHYMQREGERGKPDRFTNHVLEITKDTIILYTLILGNKEND